MCKKLLIAAVAVVAGLLVVRHTSLGSLIQVWWKDARASVEKQIPPEVRIKQLAVEIDKIDKDIKKNLSKLAAQEVDCQLLEEKVVALRTNQKQLKEDVSAMEKLLDNPRTERVVFNGTAYRTPELARKLDSATQAYTIRKTELKAKEQLLAEKKQALEKAHQYIGEMRDQKERLRVDLARLETRLETLRLKQMEAKVEFDESQVGKCNELAGKIEESLRRAEVEAKLHEDYGYRTRSTVYDREPKTTEEVLKSARKALREDEAAPDKVAVEKK
jgi:chromosome segregation ATPase